MNVDIILRAAVGAATDICLYDPTVCVIPETRTGGATRRGWMPIRPRQEQPKRKKREPVEIPDDVQVDVEVWLDPIEAPPIPIEPPVVAPKPVWQPVPLPQPEPAMAQTPEPPPVRTRTRERLDIRPRRRRPAIAPATRHRRRDESEALAVILSLL